MVALDHSTAAKHASLAFISGSILPFLESFSNRDFD